jgi:hypothetical protein
VTNTEVPPIDTSTALSACLAITPVSIFTSLLPYLNDFMIDFILFDSLSVIFSFLWIGSFYSWNQKN